MTRKLSIKRQTNLLLAGTFLLGWASYQLAITPTLKAYQVFQTLKSQAEQGQATPERLQRLQQGVDHYEKMLAGYRHDTIQRSDKLLSVLSPLCDQYQVRLITLPSARTEKSEGYVIITRRLRLEGKFVDMLRVVHALEVNASVGRVISVRFAVQETPMGGVKSLLSDLLLQQVQASRRNSDK